MNEDHRELFVREAEERLDDLVDAVRSMGRDDADAAAMDRVFRNVHTLKGNCQAMGFEETARLAHAIEDLLDEMREGRGPVSPEIVDLLVEGVDQLKAGITAIDQGNEGAFDPDPVVEALGEVTDIASPPELSGSGTTKGGDSDRGGGLQFDRSDVSIDSAVTRLGTMVHSLARQQDKEVRFTTAHANLTLDRQIVATLRDPLMHIVRNAIDHGIEPPDERSAAGKSREGTIRLRSRRDDGHVEIAVADDGRGLDVEAIRRAAIAQDLRSREELTAMDEPELRSLILHPGLSTKDEVTSISGRGVGMDVVATTIADLDGSVVIDSTPGEGTAVTLRFPIDSAT